MKFQGQVLITDEAIEAYKNVNLSGWKVKTNWDRENLLLIIDCQPSDTSLTWKWNEINNLLEFSEEVLPPFATKDKFKFTYRIILFPC
ncbi:MAG: hypothetical protein ACQEU4_17135 [Bacillota bacterium]